MALCSSADLRCAVCCSQGGMVAKIWAPHSYSNSCLLAAALSPLPLYSFGEAFIWFRFPFAMATAFWLGRDKRLLYLMILSTGIGMVTMCGIRWRKSLSSVHRVADCPGLWRSGARQLSCQGGLASLCCGGCARRSHANNVARLGAIARCYRL